MFDQPSRTSKAGARGFAHHYRQAEATCLFRSVLTDDLVASCILICARLGRHLVTPIPLSTRNHSKTDSPSSASKVLVARKVYPESPEVMRLEPMLSRAFDRLPVHPRRCNLAAVETSSQPRRDLSLSHVPSPSSNAVLCGATLSSSHIRSKGRCKISLFAVVLPGLRFRWPFRKSRAEPTTRTSSTVVRHI